MNYIGTGRFLDVGEQKVKTGYKLGNLDSSLKKVEFDKRKILNHLFQGTKGRTRICSPASNGGAQCPDKRKHKDLYYEVKDCTMKDCESIRKYHFVYNFFE